MGYFVVLDKDHSFFIRIQPLLSPSSFIEYRSNFDEIYLGAATRYLNEALENNKQLKNAQTKALSCDTCSM